MGATLVMYHYVRDADTSPHPGLFACGVAEFEAQVEELLRRAEPLEPDALVAAAREGRPIPDGFLLTFDDGVRDHWDTVLPVLERHGLHGVFAPVVVPYLEGRVPFVQQRQLVRGVLGEEGLPGAFVAAAEAVAPELDVAAILAGAPVGGYLLGSDAYRRFKYASNGLIPFDVSLRVMDRLFREHVADDEEGFAQAFYVTEAEIVEFSRRGHAIAGHSIHHPSLLHLDSEGLDHEVGDSVRWLADLIGEPVEWFCYPYGDHNPAAERACERAGVAVAYSTRPPTQWRSPADRFRVPRVDTCDLPVALEAELGAVGSEVA